MIEDKIEKKLNEFSTTFSKQTSNCSSTGRQITFAYCAICWGLLIKGNENDLSNRLIFLALFFCVIYICLDFIQSYYLSRKYNNIYIETIELLEDADYSEKPYVLSDATDCQSKANLASSKIFFFKFIFILISTLILMTFLIIKLI